MTHLAPSPTPGATRSPRHLGFRVVAVLVGVVLLLLFAALPALLTPWVDLGDSANHGWERTPAAHRWSDSGSAILMSVIGIAALLLARTPRGLSGVASWVAASLVVFAAASTASVLIQGQSGPVAAVLTGVATALVMAGPLIVLSPDRSALLRGGEPGGSAPEGLIRMLLQVTLVACVAVVAVALIWRLTGGTVESPREDDVVAFVSLGLSGALGCLICLRAKAGWRLLATLLAGMMAYAVVGGSTLLVLG